MNSRSHYYFHFLLSVQTGIDESELLEEIDILYTDWADEDEEALYTDGDVPWISECAIDNQCYLEWF